uniref:Secreted protein n=1 Tax=Mesocestoides corti TaxID=53468 RepID=A0A5K3FHV3_MESCO
MFPSCPDHEKISIIRRRPRLRIALCLFATSVTRSHLDFGHGLVIRRVKSGTWESSYWNQIAPLKFRITIDTKGVLIQTAITRNLILTSGLLRTSKPRLASKTFLVFFTLFSQKMDRFRPLRLHPKYFLIKV